MPEPLLDLLAEYGLFGGLSVFIVLSVMRGWLVPGKELKYWREMAFEEQSQKRALMRAGWVTQEVLRALPRVLEQEDPLP